jgi:DNA-binding NtrC family response regulator
MDGLETLRHIKRRWPFVEVILLTGHGSVESGIQGMELGAYDYVMKPAKLGDLIAKVEQAYERKRLREKQSQ